MKRLLLLLSYLATTAACTSAASVKTDQLSSVLTPNVVLSATYVHQSTLTLNPLPTRTPTPTSTATPTPEPYYLEATVWTSEPRVPILIYHRFLPDHYEFSTNVKMRLGDFRAHLESLYTSDYTLISLSDWLTGNLYVPEGRRPLILTIDDLFFADQISLTEEGDPSLESGLGVLWHFYLEHPDFGFHVALFPNLGDKLFPGGESELAKVIAWCIEHDAIPYNHFYTHPRLDLTKPKWIPVEAERNDIYLRELLSMAEREDLVSSLGNIIAIPYGIWPSSKAGIDAMLSYVSPEGVSLQAVLEADFAVRAKYLLPPFSPDFDPWHVPRIVGTQQAIDLLVEQRESFPRAHKCQIGPMDTERLNDLAALEEQIIATKQRGDCPNGIYYVQGLIYRVMDAEISLLPLPSPSPTPTTEAVP